MTKTLIALALTLVAAQTQAAGFQPWYDANQVANTHSDPAAVIEIVPWYLSAQDQAAIEVPDRMQADVTPIGPYYRQS